jgi:hypothetical protein
MLSCTEADGSLVSLRWMRFGGASSVAVPMLEAAAAGRLRRQRGSSPPPRHGRMGLGQQGGVNRILLFFFRRWRERRKAPCTTAGRQRRAWPSFRLRCTSRRPRYTPRCPFAERGPAQSCRPGAPRHRRGITYFRAHRGGEGAGFRAGCHYCGGSDLVLQRWIRPRAQQLLHDGRAAFASRHHKRRPTDILRSACGSTAENGGL